ncbi:hypothetical protein ACHAW6_000133 [Cyclotella cf. meneghiniana]
MFAQCDIEGNKYNILDCIIDYHKSKDALSKKGQNFTKDGRDCIHWSTKEWELLCQWKDDQKESHPLKTAEFAFAQEIANQYAFNWWVGWVLKKRDHIISKVKTCNIRYANQSTSMVSSYQRLWLELLRLIGRPEHCYEQMSSQGR